MQQQHNPCFCSLPHLALHTALPTDTQCNCGHIMTPILMVNTIASKLWCTYRSVTVNKSFVSRSMLRTISFWIKLPFLEGGWGGCDQKVLKKFYLRCAIFNRYDPPCLLSLNTPIFDRALYYLVANCLSVYQWGCFYLVWYINPQSGGICSVGLPLLLMYFICSESSCSI